MATHRRKRENWHKEDLNWSSSCITTWLLSRFWSRIRKRLLSLIARWPIKFDKVPQRLLSYQVWCLYHNLHDFAIIHSWTFLTADDWLCNEYLTWYYLRYFSCLKSTWSIKTWVGVSDRLATSNPCSFSRVNLLLKPSFNRFPRTWILTFRMVMFYQINQAPQPWRSSSFCNLGRSQRRLFGASGSLENRHLLSFLCRWPTGRRHEEVLFILMTSV